MIIIIIICYSCGGDVYLDRIKERTSRAGCVICPEDNQTEFVVWECFVNRAPPLLFIYYQCMFSGHTASIHVTLTRGTDRRISTSTRPALFSTLRTQDV